jgi:hypothetical protein
MLTPPSSQRHLRVPKKATAAKEPSDDGDARLASFLSMRRELSSSGSRAGLLGAAPVNRPPSHVFLGL